MPASPNSATIKSDAPFATFGWSGVVLLAAYALSNFWIGAGALGSLRFGGRSDSELLLAALGGFGLIACGFRTLITTAGATAAAPLTGLPAPGISYGVAAALGWGLYLGLALGTQQHRGAGSDVDANT